MSGEPDLAAVAAAFAIEGTWLGAERYGSGHINRTYLSEFETPEGRRRYLHQAIHGDVFRDVPGLMRNIERVTSHLRERADRARPGERWEVLELVPTRSGAVVHRAADGRSWRTFPCIEGARTYDVAPTPDIAREAARGFGRFARDLADFDPSRLVESIPRFHDLEGRLARLRGVTFEDPVGRAAIAEAELESVWARVELADELREVRANGGLPVRVTHNDTKVNNVLLDDDTGRAVAVIDLDTVMPGTLLFDFGDLVRTATCPAPEDETDPSRVFVDFALFDAVAEGYVGEIASFATSTELESLLLGGRFITFIIGVRFLTDYLEGDAYFPTSRPHQNLDRARTQLALLRSLERYESELRAIVDRHRGG